MQTPNPKQALRQAAARLAELLGKARTDMRARQDSRAPEADAVIEIAGATFVVEYRGSGSVAPVSAAIEEVRRHASAVSRRAIPLVVVPFMGPAGGRRCEEAQIGWLDLSGNARIFGPGIHVLIEGRPNLFKSRGRPFSAFAPKSARIARWLLIHPRQALAQREIAQATGMEKGFTSRIVSRLEKDGLVARSPDGAVRPRDPDRLLDAWREDYDFSKHQVHRGYIVARSGEEALRLLAEGLRAEDLRYAATGLAAAWLLARFAGFRLVTIFVEECPARSTLERLGFREDERGANVWLVVPKDEGVFHGAIESGGVACVHPVQAYLDLKDQPERAKEAAEHLRATLLNWNAGG